jgi:CCR4-NOT complex subunit CAF16
MSELVARIHDLEFVYRPGGAPALRIDRFDLFAGERWLVVGANGAGKSTLLQVLAGQHMVRRDAVRVLGRPAFDDCDLVRDVRFVGGAFPLTVDITVREILENRVPEDPKRRTRLMRVLDIDEDWHMHRVSDGQRRRVHLLLHLEAPRKLLLLDEVTTDLDVVVRADLLELLKGDFETHGTAVVYATHIFDGLEDWATHIALLERGRILRAEPLATLPELSALHAASVSSPLYRVVERWIRHGATAPTS